jgi:hypothetical protein
MILVSLDFVDIFFLLMIFNLAHGEKWDVNDKPTNNNSKTTILSTLSKVRPQSYSNRSRSRSNYSRRSLVRLRSDISQPRPAYTRSQSRPGQNNRQSEINNSVLSV